VLSKCEYGKDNYNLPVPARGNIVNPPLLDEGKLEDV